MFEILAALPAIVKPADLETTVQAIALVAATDLDDSWIMDDSTADQLSDEAESYGLYEAGHPAW